MYLLSHPVQYLIWSKFKNVCQLDGCIILLWFLIFSSLIPNEIEHLSNILLAIWIFSFVGYLFKSSPHLFIGQLSFSYCFLGTLCVSWMLVVGCMCYKYLIPLFGAFFFFLLCSVFW